MANEILSTFRIYLHHHDLKGAILFFADNYEAINSSLDSYKYQCLEILLILSLKYNEWEIFDKILSTMKSLPLDNEYSLNLTYWECEKLFSLNDYSQLERILRQIDPDSFINAENNTKESFINLYKRMQIRLPEELIYRSPHRSDWNTTKNTFNLAVSYYSKRKYKESKTLFSRILNEKIKHHFIKGYCFIYLARMEDRIFRKKKYYTKAKTIFKRYGNNRFHNYVIREMKDNGI